MLTITKRQKITISSVFLAASLFFLLPTLSGNRQYYALSFIVLASYILSVWSIYASFASLELVILFVLPVLLTASFGLFLIGFDPSLNVRILLSAVYIVTMYTILLTENIFNVSVERNIPLVRAARTVGYLATLFVTFAFFSLIFGLGLGNFVFAAIATVVGAALLAQGLWQIKLKETDFSLLGYFSGVSGLIIGEVSLGLSFWPLDPPKVGLALAATTYVLLGIFQHRLREDLTKRAAAEYLFVAAAVVFLLIALTSWGV